jgi:DNA-binding NarL/FixJ family response regulator
MTNINIIIADGNYLTREGLKSLIHANRDFCFVAEADNQEDLFRRVNQFTVDLLIIDATTANFSIDTIKKVIICNPRIRILAITAPQSKRYISLAITEGVTSYLLKDCDKDEIIEAIYATSKGENFYCGKIVNGILNAPASTTLVQATETEKIVSCEGIRISSREVEIILLIAEGLTNKQIADKLFLSTHTITTHRKNIMNKVGVNNTAGLVLFALKENIISPNKFLFSGIAN